MSELVDTSTDSEVDVDGLLNDLHEPSEGFRMKADAPPEPATPTVQEYEYDWRGQKVKEPIDMILKRASMGRDYNHLLEGFNKEKSDWTSKMTEREKALAEQDKKYSRYKEVDEYIGKDPEWWEHVQQSYAEKRQNQPQQQQAQPDPKVLELESRLSVFEQKEQELRVSKEDEAFNADMQGIREKYPDLPWDVPGQDGKSLVYKVLEHGTKEGIKSFKTAFLDFYHQDLEKRWESRGREAVAKDTQKRTKMGLLGETQAPKKGLSNAKNIKNSSYDDLTKEALEELGIN